MKIHPHLGTVCALAAFIGFFSLPIHADVVSDWNALLGTAQKASGQTASGQSRNGAIVQAAVFDAVNGIVRKYHPYLVTADAPLGASPTAAAVQAAYTALVVLYPAQVGLFDAQLAASVAGLAGTPQSIADGRAWGEAVALDFLAWRSTDGFRNAFTFFGGPSVGYWRPPTPPGLSGVNANFATMEPFTLNSPAQFRPIAPYGVIDRPAALTTAAYAADVNEVKARGSLTSVERTPEQTAIARFWQAVDNADQNNAIRSVVPPAYQLVDTARLLALCSMAACDAAIGVYDGKYSHALWRPIDAIRLADADNNAATEADPAWTSLVTTPRHPEYPSAHAMISGAMLGTAALVLGDHQTFTISTPLISGYTRTFYEFSAAVDEVVEARIWIGFHFRAACVEGREAGYKIARHAVETVLRPLQHGEHWPQQASHGWRGHGGQHPGNK